MAEINLYIPSKKSSKHHQSYELKLLVWLLCIGMNDLYHPKAPKCLKLFFGDEKSTLEVHKVELTKLVTFLFYDAEMVLMYM